MRQALSGAAEAGLSTTVLPQISAGASFQAGIARREIPGRDQADHADGFADGEHVHAVALGRHQHPGQARAFAGEVAEDVDGAAHLALGFGQRLALFAGHLGGDGLEVPVQDVGRLIEDGSARRSGHGAPAGEGGQGGGGRGVDIGGAALGKGSDQFPGGGVAVFKCGAACGPFAVDVVSEHLELYLWSGSSAGLGLEIGIVAGKPAHAGDDVVREKFD